MKHHKKNKANIENNTIFVNAATIGGHVHVEDYAILGGLSGVHQFCRIGKYAMVGGAVAVRKDVVPYAVVKGEPPRTRGVNFIGLKRHGFTPSVIKDIKQAFVMVFSSNYNTSQALKELRRKTSNVEEVEYLIKFIENSKRGIIK